MSSFDVAEAIAVFIADPSCDTLELPHMTTGQRTQAKKIMEKYPELRCESYGFGADRQLHVFKRGTVKESQADPPAAYEAPEGLMNAVSIKNTFIDGWAGCEPEPMVFRSLQAPLSKDILGYVANAEESCQRADGSDCSTSASDKEFQESSLCPESSMVQKREVKTPTLQDMAVVHVRNTFIHLEAASTDERVVQSMPHGMFGQYLSAERSQKETNANESDAKPMPPPGSAFSPGALVVVEGLEKSPAFNGLSAVVQNWDEACGRYTVIFGSIGVNGSCQQAKIKEGNLRLLLPCP
jgi:hypothetical protein